MTPNSFVDSKLTSKNDVITVISINHYALSYYLIFFAVEAGGPTYYDAFVCYHPEGEDLKFVQTMIEKMETPQNKLKLFVPHRDDLPGASKHVISAKLIQDR